MFERVFKEFGFFVVQVIYSPTLFVQIASMLSHMLDASRQQFSTRCVAIVREGYEPSKARGQ